MTTYCAQLTALARMYLEARRYVRGRCEIRIMTTKKHGAVQAAVVRFRRGPSKRQHCGPGLEPQLLLQLAALPNDAMPGLGQEMLAATGSSPISGTIITELAGTIYCYPVPPSERPPINILLEACSRITGARPRC